MNAICCLNLICSDVAHGRASIHNRWTLIRSNKTENGDGNVIAKKVCGIPGQIFNYMNTMEEYIDTVCDIITSQFLLGIWPSLGLSTAVLAILNNGTRLSPSLHNQDLNWIFKSSSSRAREKWIQDIHKLFESPGNEVGPTGLPRLSNQ